MRSSAPQSRPLLATLDSLLSHSSQLLSQPRTVPSSIRRDCPAIRLPEQKTDSSTPLSDAAWPEVRYCVCGINSSYQTTSSYLTYDLDFILSPATPEPEHPYALSSTSYLLGQRTSKLQQVATFLAPSFALGRVRSFSPLQTCSRRRYLCAW